MNENMNMIMKIWATSHCGFTIVKSRRNCGNGWVQKGWHWSCGDGIESRVTEQIRVGYQQWGLWDFETRGTRGSEKWQPWPLMDSISETVPSGKALGEVWKWLFAKLNESAWEVFTMSQMRGSDSSSRGLDWESFQEGSAHGNKATQREPQEPPSWRGLLCACLYLSFLAFVVSWFSQ